jgi:hypothetical protein
MVNRDVAVGVVTDLIRARELSSLTAPRAEAEQLISALERIGVAFSTEDMGVEYIPVTPRPTEIVRWERLREFPGYEISTDGRVRDHYNKKERSTRGGRVMLQRGMMRTTRTIAKLLEEAFGNG